MAVREGNLADGVFLQLNFIGGGVGVGDGEDNVNRVIIKSDASKRLHV